MDGRPWSTRAVNTARTLSSAALALVVAATASTLAAPPAQAASTGLVVALGDSYPSGDGGGGNWHRGYPEMSAAALSTASRPLVTRNWAQSGVTTDFVLQTFNSRADLRSQVAVADYVIITIGANDVLYKHEDPRAAARSTAGQAADIDLANRKVDSILGTVSRLRRGNVKNVVVVDYNTVYRQGSAATWAGPDYARGSDNITRHLNAGMMNNCLRRGMTCVDAFWAFRGSNVQQLVTPDGTHPSTLGHRVYANKVIAAARARR